MKKTRIIVADDHAVVRMGFVALLESEKDIEVVGEAGDGAAAVALARRTRPDVMLMDLVMPRQDGIAATAAVKQILPQTKVFILTTFTDADGIRRALDAGADGAMLKSSDYSEVIAAIRRVVAGERVLAPEVRKMLENDVPPPDLTPRQLDVLTLMTRGLTNADIAAQLGITPDGVKFHITSILAKLGAVGGMGALPPNPQNRSKPNPKGTTRRARRTAPRRARWVNDFLWDEYGDFSRTTPQRARRISTDL